MFYIVNFQIAKLQKKMVRPHQIRFYALYISLNDTFKGWFLQLFCNACCVI